MKGTAIKREPEEEEAVHDQKEIVTTSADTTGIAEEPSTSQNVPLRKGPMRRTRTGCLTCRSRRIKCGEEKPICNNCIKSKRFCDYVPRVVFKHHRFMDNLGTLAPNQQISMGVPVFGGYAGHVPFVQPGPEGSHQGILVPATAGFPIVGQPAFPATGMTQMVTMSSFHYSQVQMRAPAPPYSQNAVMTEFLAPHAEAVPHGQPQVTSGVVETSTVYFCSEAAVSSVPHFDGNCPNQTGQTNFWTVSSSSTGSHQYTTSHLLSHRVPDGLDRDPASVSQRPTPFQFPVAEPLPNDPAYYQQQPYPHIPYPPHIPSSHGGYIDEESEDYYDVEPDDELLDPTEGEDFDESSGMASGNWDGRQMDPFTACLNKPTAVVSYSPNLGSFLLNSPEAGRLFAHFRYSTGPFMSIFERYSTVIPGIPIPTVQQGLWTDIIPLKALQHQALLRAILAMSSLHLSMLQQAPPTSSWKHYHHALRDISTAVGLPLWRKQIGTLAATLVLGYYEVTAADHSKWCSHLAGSAQLIREIDFASMTRDIRAHRRRVRAQRRQMLPAEWQFETVYPFGGAASEDDPFADKESGIDENLIGLLMGRAVNYDEFGQVDDGRTQAPKTSFTRKDIENYRIQSDLYWFYCKCDFFQSMLSGNQLLIPYYQWGQCQPRSGMGQLDAVYGSADHLWLLLARLADFGYRDRKRKLRIARTTGKEWVPNPGFYKFMTRFACGGGGGGGGPKTPGEPTTDSHGVQSSVFFGGPSTSHPGDIRSAYGQDSPSGQHPDGQPPGAKLGVPPLQGTTPSRRESSPLYGLIPSSGPTRLPSAFAKVASPTATSPDQEDGLDEQTAYNKSEEDWETILAAFDTFANALGPDYLPLPPDQTPLIPTPFGPSLKYKFDIIAVVWGFYYCGRILLYRLHPSMPPAMTVAAGVSAPTTAEYAQIIAKIIAGIYYTSLQLNPEPGSLTPTLAACLTEMTLALFMAAVQYIDPAQRHWTISTLHSIWKLTGWKTANVIAGGCEKSWITAARKGRGPAYYRFDESHNNDGDRDTDSSRKRRLWDDEQQQVDVNSERRLIAVSRSARVHWAVGILGLEDDMLNIGI